jgi:hypothetical protein
MEIVNIHQAKTNFSHLINQDEKKSTPRKGGQLKGILIIEDNFDDPLPEEVLKSFYDEGDL